MRNTDLLSRCAGGIIVGSFFLLTFSCKKGSDERVGIIPNPSFEESEDGAPKYWKSYRWTSRSEAQFEHSLSGRGEEGRSVMIASEKGADASWSGNVPVRPFSTYRLSGWIKTENLASKTGRGALFNLHGMDDAETEEVTGTQDWTRVEMTFDTERNDAVQINCLFGGWGTATGKAWYDDLELEWLSSREIAHPSITIGTSRSGEPISKYIYGQFIEHLGRCIYGGIWSEMLEDRKFFYPVTDTYAPWSVKDDPWVKAGLFPILVASPWKVVGPAGTVQMDTQNPFVGEHTPVVRLTGDGQACGISQEGLALIKGKAYEGRIVLAGDVEAAPVEVRLVLDSGKALSHRIEILQTEYQTTPFRFEASSSSDNAVLEIVSRGRGSLRVGTVSLMPADHIKGFRADVIALLKELDSPIYRWPGGNFVSGYDWRDGIGERDRRPPRKNPAWTGVEHNDVGIHEYMDLMEIIGAEPFIAVNTGLGTVEEVGEEVEYCNGSADTPMGRLRAENGHPEPFRVKWWAVGNEMYGSWQLGHMPLEEYVKKHNRVVEAMRRVDPSIRLVAVGEVGRWSQTMLKECGDYMDL
ncbi:MAG: alpha-L-arabinofuranosidase, partial [bacterium]